MAALNVAACTEADIPLVMRYIDREWRSSHVLSRDRQLLSWMYDASRAPERMFVGPSILLARCGTEIVGMLGVIAYPLNVRGRRGSGAWISLWHVKESQRFTNAAMALLRCVHDCGFDCVGAVGVNQHARRVLTAMGYQVTRVPRYVCVLDAATVAAWLIAIGAPGVPASNTLPVGDGFAGGDAFEFSDFAWDTASAADWDAHWRTNLAPRGVGTEKSAEYIDWRYVEHPSFRYDVRCLRHQESGRVAGCFVSRFERAGPNGPLVMRVLELLAQPDSVGMLARAAIRWALRGGACMLDHYTTDSAGAAALLRAGFMCADDMDVLSAVPSHLNPVERTPRELMAAYKFSDGEFARDEHEVCFVRGDGDQDRPN